MTKAAEQLDLYLHYYSCCPHSSKWKGGPGQVILNAPPEHQEAFKQLKSDDIANPADHELAAWMAMSKADTARWHLRQEVSRLLTQADREIERHRKFTLPGERV